MTAFLLALLRVLGVALVAGAAGWAIARALLPRDESARLERLGWAFAVGVSLLAAFVPLSLWVGVRPGWLGFAILSAACLGVSLKFQVSSLKLKASDQLETWNLKLETSPTIALLGGLIVLGVALYALASLTEPMWSNDFIAIWGLKGKVIFLSGGVPDWLRGWPGYAHPEYPLGLPFLYAGTAFLTGRWDDHATALLFPLFQIATLAVVAGWLRRRGAPRTGVLLAAAILANFQPLYSAFLTGLADVPLALGLLLFGTALADALEGEPGALRRTALASALIAATKNEGLFFAAAGCAIALLFGGKRRFKAALAALPTALLVHGLHLAWRGRLPLRDFDFGTASAGRVVEALAAAVRLPGWIGWAQLLLLAALIGLGRRVPEGGWLLALCAAGLAAYLLLPVFAVRGPEWLIQTALPRTSAGLAPLAAAAIAIRLRPVGR